MQNMEIEELGKTSLTAVELETLDWTLSKQKKLTAFPELCISFHMNEIVCHAMLFFFNMAAAQCCRLCMINISKIAELRCLKEGYTAL